jgi:hypothetical protein
MSGLGWRHCKDIDFDNLTGQSKELENVGCV